jgi:hypothetical protein
VHDRAHTRHNVIDHRFGPVLDTLLDYARLSDSPRPTPCCKTRSDMGLPGPTDFRTVVQVNLKKLVGFLVVIFVLFWIISAPTSASGTVEGLMASLKEAGQSLVTFMTNVAN